MYVLGFGRRHIERILSGSTDEYWCTMLIIQRGKVAFIDSETDMLLGFGELTDIWEIPFSEYLQFYGVRRHRWEAVPLSNGEQRAYAYVFRNSYPVSNPRKTLSKRRTVSW